MLTYAERHWEELNAVDPDKEKIFEASKSVEIASKKVNEAGDWLYIAIEEAADTGAEDRLRSMLNDLENLLCDIQSLQTKMQKGEC